jgi:hypothetical protein
VTVALAIVCGLAGAGAWAFGERLGAWTLRVAEKRADAAKWRAAYTKELDHSADLHAQLRMAKAEALGTESQLRAEIRALTTRLEGRLPPRGSGHPNALRDNFREDMAGRDASADLAAAEEPS